MKKYRTYGAKEGQDLEMKNRNISFVWQTLFPFSKKNQLQNILFFISHQLV
jgi:methionine salvage enolase-phosphatase E1